MTDLPPVDFDRCQPSYDPPPPGHVSGSRLERVLRQGQFAVTAELNPPDSADPADVFAAARPLARVADAINATDASGANCHMSSIGISALLTRAGIGTVYQISCRDRNRIAIQGTCWGRRRWACATCCA
ncbi:methylenetetrahydrofolate reductase [uncultured Paracoccus sp.]|uniref:methylenetetrahydrofolate reductase n=1 Tax=uncultured Paracoccus sp. TaxID=189685 RepID=UPI0030D965CC